MENTAPNETSKRKHVATKVSKKELEWLGHILAGHGAVEAGKRIGKTKRAAKHTQAWLRADRESSSKPELWDIWRAALDRQLRILDAQASNIIRELAIIGFSSIDRFIDFPSRADAIADMKADNGPQSVTLDSDEIEDEENDSHAWKKYRPGATIKLKCLEDIPSELMPAIAEIHETKEGIRIKLHNKLDALDKLCRIQKLYASELPITEDDDKEINIVVNGSKSKLLPPANVTINI